MMSYDHSKLKLFDATSKMWLKLVLSWIQCAVAFIEVQIGFTNVKITKKVKFNIN